MLRNEDAKLIWPDMHGRESKYWTTRSNRSLLASSHVDFRFRTATGRRLTISGCVVGGGRSCSFESLWRESYSGRRLDSATVRHKPPTSGSGGWTVVVSGRYIDDVTAAAARSVDSRTVLVVNTWSRGHVVTWWSTRGQRTSTDHPLRYSCNNHNSTQPGSAGAFGTAVPTATTRLVPARTTVQWWWSTVVCGGPSVQRFEQYTRSV